VFPDLRIDLLHGRMSGATKDDVMRRFRDRAFDVLVATSVIEVGIDIPNATVMLIEGADRFGLSQLHQFRGRVGRGGGASYCLLLADDASALGEERLRMMESTTDGFQLAEADLRMRGPGDFLGTRQSGLPDLQMLRTGFDSRLLTMARKAAEQTLDKDADLSQPENRLLRVAFDRFWLDSVSAFAGA
jgi:ATP-dependent DNA helicase RecG